MFCILVGLSRSGDDGQPQGTHTFTNTLESVHNGPPHECPRPPHDGTFYDSGPVWHKDGDIEAVQLRVGDARVLATTKEGGDLLESKQCFPENSTEGKAGFPEVCVSTTVHQQTVCKATTQGDEHTINEARNCEASSVLLLHKIANSCGGMREDLEGETTTNIDVGNTTSRECAWTAGTLSEGTTPVEPHVEGAITTPVEPHAEGDITTPVEPHVEGAITTPVEPHAEGAITTPVEPHAEGAITTPVEPHAEGAITTPVEPHAEGAITTPVEPHAEGAITIPVEPHAEGAITTPVEPHAEGDITTPVEPHAEGAITTPVEPHAEGAITTPVEPHAEGAITTPVEPHAEGSELKGSSCGLSSEETHSASTGGGSLAPVSEVNTEEVHCIIDASCASAGDVIDTSCASAGDVINTSCASDSTPVINPQSGDQDVRSKCFENLKVDVPTQPSEAVPTQPFEAEMSEAVTTQPSEVETSEAVPTQPLESEPVHIPTQPSEAVTTQLSEVETSKAVPTQPSEAIPTHPLESEPVHIPTQPSEAVTTQPSEVETSEAVPTQPSEAILTHPLESEPVHIPTQPSEAVTTQPSEVETSEAVPTQPLESEPVHIPTQPSEAVSPTQPPKAEPVHVPTQPSEAVPTQPSEAETSEAVPTQPSEAEPVHVPTQPSEAVTTQPSEAVTTQPSEVETSEAVPTQPSEVETSEAVTTQPSEAEPVHVPTQPSEAVTTQPSEAEPVHVPTQPSEAVTTQPSEAEPVHVPTQPSEAVTTQPSEAEPVHVPTQPSEAVTTQPSEAEPVHVPTQPSEAVTTQPSEAEPVHVPTQPSEAVTTQPSEAEPVHVPTQPSEAVTTQPSEAEPVHVPTQPSEAVTTQPSEAEPVHVPTQPSEAVTTHVPTQPSEAVTNHVPTQPSEAVPTQPSEVETSEAVTTQPSEAEPVHVPTQPSEAVTTQPSEAEPVHVPTQPSEAEPTQPSEAEPVHVPTQPSEAVPTQPSEAEPTQPSEAEPVHVPTQPSEAVPTQPSEAVPTQPSEVVPTHVPTQPPEAEPVHVPTQPIGNGSDDNNSKISLAKLDQVMGINEKSDSDNTPTSPDEGSSRGSSATPEPSSTLEEKDSAQGTLEASHSERDTQKSPLTTLEDSQSPHRVPGSVTKQFSMSSMPKRLSFSSKRLMKTLASIGKRPTQVDDDPQLQTVELNKRVASAEWDPTCLLEELYGDHQRVPPVQLALTGETARHFGYMEKLPVNQLKPTMTKKWKRRYFRIMEGNIYYYEHRTDEKALNFFRLENCKLQSEPKKLQAKVTASDGSFLVMRVTDENDLAILCRTIELESTHPTICAPLAPQAVLDNSVVIIDIGASSVRAGFAGKNVLPQLFFPAVCCINRTTSEVFACGHEALLPDNRAISDLVYPRRATLRMDKRDTNLPSIAYIVRYVLAQLNVQAGSTYLLMTLPLTTTDKEKHGLAEMLFEAVGILGLCFQDQALLSLYSYNTTSGIVVDIGDHIDIVPMQDGFIVESGVFRLPFGGNAITEHLSKLITTKGVRYFSETEAYITRLIKESICYVSQNYAEDVERCDANMAAYTRAFDVARFHLPDHRKVIALDSALFKAPEGLLNPNMWGKDVRGLHQLVWESVQACSIDQRREMLRSIYLSGGTSRLPGLKERLEGELRLLAPNATPVQVHVSEHSNHAAFMGGCVLATMNSFSNVLVTRDEWSNTGVEAFRKSK